MFVLKIMLSQTELYDIINIMNMRTLKWNWWERECSKNINSLFTRVFSMFMSIFSKIQLKLNKTYLMILIHGHCHLFIKVLWCIPYTTYRNKTIYLESNDQDQGPSLLQYSCHIVFKSSDAYNFKYQNLIDKMLLLTRQFIIKHTHFTYITTCTCIWKLLMHRECSHFQCQIYSIQVLAQKTI